MRVVERGREREKEWKKELKGRGRVVERMERERVEGGKKKVREGEGR